MDERASRIFVGLSVLVLVWIGVYWLWVPSTPRVSYGGQTPPAPTTQDETSAPEQLDRIADQPAEHAPEQVADPLWMGETPSQPGVIPPGFWQYTIKRGDTFETIAREQWGDAGLWTVVARANPLKDPKRLKGGQSIRLPNEIGNIQGVAINEPEQPAERTHIVQRGDTLSSIAAEHLGSSAQAGRVFELNRDRLRDMHSLQIGQELRLPPLDSGG